MTTQDIRNLIAAAKTGKAIEELQKINFKDADAKNTMAMLSARFADYQRQKRLGITGGNDLNIELNKINMALLGFLDEISEETSTNSTLNQGKTKSLLTFDNFKSTIAILAGIAGILTFYFKFCSNGSSEGENTNVTVFVEDKNHDLILKNQGYVIMEADGGEAKKEEINGKGAAPFQNVKIGSKVRLKVDFSEPYRPLLPDSVYTIPKNGVIHLLVGLQHLDKIFGTVIYKDQPLAGVIVETLGLKDTTDNTGSYEINIPEGKQDKDPEVKFLKQGFKMAIKKAYPQTNEPLNIVMEKESIK